MALHESLRDLVSMRGPGVVDEAEELRGALDDFLAEDEATVGELNLLVDAVRLGALRRVLDVLEHGAHPPAAIQEAGAALARDRGTDDPTRSCWAIAALCFALSKTDESLVRAFRAGAGTMSVPGRPTDPSIAPGRPQATDSSTAERPQTQMLDDGAAATSSPQQASPPPTPLATPPPVPPAAPEPAASRAPDPTVRVHSDPVAPVGAPIVSQVQPEADAERRGKAGLYLFVLLIALIVGGLVATGLILIRSGDEDPVASSDGASDSESPRGPRKDKQPPPLVPAGQMLVPYKEGESSIIYSVDTDGGGFRALTEGDNDVLPTVSPDRRTATYLRGPRPPTLIRIDLESETEEPFFPEPGPCDHALRPGWNANGTQVAMVCLGDDELADGIWLAGADGRDVDPDPLVDDTLVRGSPTWISPTELIYGRQDDASEDAPLTFWRVDVRNGEPTQLDLGLEGLQLTHADYSPEADKVLFLVSPRGSEEVGDVWIMDPDGSGAVQLATGDYAHPVWSPDGRAIGVTVLNDAGEEVLGYIPLDDAGDAAEPIIVENVPPGEVGIPVWGTR